MTKRDLAVSIAASFLNPPYLEVTQRIVDELFRGAMKDDDPDRAESIGKIRGELRKLAKREVGGGA